MKTARQLAVEILMTVNNNGGYSNIVLDKALKQNQDMSKEEEGFCSALFYGTLENKLFLDYIISKYSSKKLNKLSKEVLEILRLSFYQLVFMKNIPNSAVVNEAVKLTKKLRVASASGFVNAVLRSFLRDGGNVPEIKVKSKDEFLSIKYSCGKDIVSLLLSQYDEKTVEEFLNRSNNKRGCFLKTNTTKISSAKLSELFSEKGIENEIDDMLDDAIYIKNQGSVVKLSEFSKGYFHIEDKSSQICAKLVGAGCKDKVLDSCAAPGGKSFSIAEDMEGKGELISCDIHNHKIKLINDGAKRLGLSNIKAMLNDASKPNKELGTFDKVLCDVPCSGLGIMGNKPEIKYKSVADFERLPQIQYNILKTCSAYVKPGGTLTYSTCTINKKENEEVINRFLSENNDFEPLVNNNLGIKSFMTTFIDKKYNCDGFFTATLIKKNWEAFWIEKERYFIP